MDMNILVIESILSDLKMEDMEREIDKIKSKKTNLKQRNMVKKRLLEKGLSETDRYHGAGYYKDIDTGVIKRYNYRKKDLKKESNKRVRKNKNIGNHSNYKKVFDLWWILF